nr:ATP-binding protein [Hufsiella arboris]
MIVANSIFFLNQFYKNEDNFSALNRSYYLIENANVVLADIKTASENEQNYLITKETRYKLLYGSTKRELLKSSSRFYAQIAEAGETNDAIESLQKLISKKISDMDELIDRNDDLAANIRYVNSEEAHILSNVIESKIKRIAGLHRNILAAKSRDIKNQSSQLQLFSIASNWALLTFVIVAFITIMRNRKRIADLFIRIARKNELLEAKKNNLQAVSEHLRQQNDELERFAYIASHDLRSPAINQLALLKLYVQSKTEGEKEEIFGALVETSECLVAKLDDIIEDLRLKHEAIDTREVLSFNDVYCHVVKNLSADIKSTGARINCDFSDAPKINVHRTFLESILQNLLSNAIKYRHPEREPQISIRSYLNDSKICFAVSDNGLGIDLEKNGESLFNLYSRFHKNADGKGVGLYITRKQVLALGGSIDVNSMPDVGSTFTVNF